ncbi:MAG: hypothetical protein LBV17_06515 [Treponema sp.]|jgi:hypothetical protein|nr:hypothetical protein [Treponema sp.]
MGARAEAQETVKYLLEKIITYNKSKHREYYELSFDIQKKYSIDDYLDMLSHMENRIEILCNNEETINELSDTDIFKLKQMLSYTANFLGLNTNDITMGAGYMAIQAEFPVFDYFDFPNPLELLLYFIDPRGVHIGRETDPLPRELSQGEKFGRMSPPEQMEYLKNRYERSKTESNYGKGSTAQFMRHLRRYMSLDDLFAEDEVFINGNLREFLNINLNGVDRYTMQDMKKSGWYEKNSIGSQYHQSTASDGRVRILFGPNQTEFKWVYNRLNAKFTNTDGREAVFRYPGVHIREYPDRGTFNYANSFLFGHNKYDVDPFKKNPPHGYYKTSHIYNIGVFGNKHYWVY